MGRLIWGLGLFVIAAASLPPTVHADDRAACYSSNLEGIIVGCSAIIAEGKDTKVITAIAYVSRGYAYHSKGEIDRAIKDYDQAIALYPKFALAYYNRGGAYNEKGKYSLAIKDFDKAITLNLKFRQAYFGRGKAYENIGNNKLAEADYRKVLSLDPEDKDAAEALKRVTGGP